MKKNYSTKLSKRLGQYGSLALAITGLTEANSQVVYTDVNPDYSGSLGSSYAIDFDNDGTDDITFVNYASYFSFYALYANPTGTNEILGSISGGFTYPFALNSGDTISSGAGSFFDNSYINSMNWWGSDGNWIGVTDKYLGVKFDISGQTHFGWIRLDVSANSTFIVKDYAYESTPNTLILAGDQVGALPCAAPTALTVDTYDENSVDFSWTASADETDGYDWAIFAENADINTDTPILTGSVATGITNASATGLDPETPYDIYVQTNCTSNTSSDWEGPLNFTTETLSIDNYSELSELKFYPNPVSSILNLESNHELKSIEIFDLLGKKVKEIKLQNTITKINMSSLEKGTYFLKVYSVSSFEIIKVIKE